MSAATPTDLSRAFVEAQSCFRVRAYVAAAIMCRKTLEGICEAKGARAQNLMTALSQLKEHGDIDDRLYAWADALRIMGNEAAHGLEVVVSKEDAKDVLDFTEAIIDYLFVYRQRFEAFKERRNKQTSEPVVTDP